MKIRCALFGHWFGDWTRKDPSTQQRTCRRCGQKEYVWEVESGPKEVRGMAVQMAARHGDLAPMCNLCDLRDICATAYEMCPWG